MCTDQVSGEFSFTLSKASWKIFPVKMLREFDRDKLIVNGDIAKYPLSYNRGQKRLSYVYMPKAFALSLHKVHSSQKVVLTIKHQSGLSPKYLRKWFYNFLILNNVPESVADFIEGRSPESVGSMHYLAKVKQADYWYHQVLDAIKNLIT
jgi:intergrase/recombinase